jgi:ribonuclease VapC
LILDSSAVVAVLREEPGWEELEQKMLDAKPIAIGAPTLVEVGIVMASASGEDGLAALSRFIRDLNVVVIPFDQVHWEAALDAFVGFGKGRHQASLNYGDCMAYATARRAERPLLYIGNDFAQTDIQAA